MTPNEWAGLAVAVTTLVGTLALTVRHLVKYYLSENLQSKWESVLDHPDMPKIADPYRNQKLLHLFQRHKKHVLRIVCLF